MSKVYPQVPAVVWEVPGTAVSACTSGSAHSNGFAYLVGGIYSSASSVGGSGLRIRQSYDHGAHWDHVTAACEIAATTSASYKFDVHGNAVQVEFRPGSAAASVRAWFALRPV